MDAVPRGEGAVGWILRAVVRYVLLFAVGWTVFIGVLVLMDDGSSGPGFGSLMVSFGLGMLAWFGIPAVVVILALAPWRRHGAVLRPIAVVASLPHTVLFGLFGGGTFLLGMVLIQACCMGTLRVAPRGA